MKVTLRISIENTYSSGSDQISGSISISGRKIHRGHEHSQTELTHTEQAIDCLKAYLLDAMVIRNR